MASIKTELTTALHALPRDWSLTPVSQKKAYFAGWQQTGLSRESIEEEIITGRADGFGILTGQLSGGLIAIDCDGSEPHARFREILGDDIPETVSFASGRDGRAQYLFSVPQEHWANVSTKKEGDANNGGQLEWRWSGCYSVLPPSAHPETDGYQWVKSPDECSIAPLPDKALKYLLNPNQPRVKPIAKPAPKKADNVPPIPLERCLSNAHRQALENGVGEGGRSNTAISLARDLLGCTAWLDDLKEPYSGDAQSLYIEYCDRCSPPINDRERDATWRSANKYSPEPSINDPEAFQNCIDRWKREHGITATQPTFDQDEPNDGQNLKRLLTSDDYDLLSAIAEPLRGLIKKESERWSLPPLVYVSVLLPIVLSLSKVDTVLNAKETKGKPILWTCLVGSSNSGKSESSGAMIAPLEALQDDATGDFELKMAEFKHDRKSFDEASRTPASKRTEEQQAAIAKFSDVEPVEPSCKEYYLSDYTQEVVGKVLKPQKDSGLLIYMDELKPFFCFDRYTSGSGNRARTLQWYDSKGIKINRKGDDRIHISKTAISLIGTTQQTTLESLIKEDPSMEDGLWARLSLIHVPTTPTYSHEPEADNPIDSHLKRVYGDLRNNSATTFTLSNEAKVLWANWYNETVDSAINQNSDFLASIYGKAKDRAARIALALHLLNAAINRKNAEPEVSAETLKHAIAINRLMLHDTEKLLGLVGATTELDEARILKFVTKFEGKTIDTTGVKNWWPTRSKPARQAIRNFMKSIVDLGFAKANDQDHTNPKYEITVFNTLEASSIRPKTPKELLGNNHSVVHQNRPSSSTVVHSPDLDDETVNMDDQKPKMDDGGRHEDEASRPSETVDGQGFQEDGRHGRRSRGIENKKSDSEEQPIELSVSPDDEA